MNIFILAQLVGTAANFHCDKHCIKMILEICQLLYTAHWHGRDNPDWIECEYKPYRPTHKNHPCSIWVRASKNHYDWALNLGLELCKEYTRRYGKTHKCLTHLHRLQAMGYPELIQPETYEPPPKKRATVNCPNGCEYFDCAINDKIFDDCAVYVDNQLDCVETYRNYYRTKEWAMRWNRQDNPPSWFKTNKRKRISDDNLPNKKRIVL